uniref:Uncharacterized protein n=1 Tax=Xanthomonas citri pv. phaseoli var. fuscans TaxID=473423 RepID=A0A808FJC0_XANCI
MDAADPRLEGCAEPLYDPVRGATSSAVTQTTVTQNSAHAHLAPCGEGRLCATFEKNGPRYGNQRQYRAINLRATSDSQ